MEITDEQRYHVEQNANAIQQSLYSSPESGRALRGIATKYGLYDGGTYYKFCEMVGDVILGFYKTSDVSALVYHSFPLLSPEDQATLTKEIEVFLLPLQEIGLSAGYATPTVEHEGVAYKNTPVTDSLNTDPTEVSKSAQSVTPGIRTMARDIEAISLHDDVVHSAASQSDLLQKQSDPEPRPGPRWESE